MHAQFAGGSPHWNAAGTTVVLLLPRRKLMVVSTTRIQTERPRKKTQGKSECDGSEAHKRSSSSSSPALYYMTGLRSAAQRTTSTLATPPPSSSSTTRPLLRRYGTLLHFMEKSSCALTGCLSSRTGPLKAHSRAGIERCAAAATMCLCCVKWDVRAAKARNFQLL